jgi:hypothetical protein
MACCGSEKPRNRQQSRRRRQQQQPQQQPAAAVATKGGAPAPAERDEELSLIPQAERRPGRSGGSAATSSSSQPHSTTAANGRGGQRDSAAEFADIWRTPYPSGPSGRLMDEAQRSACLEMRRRMPPDEAGLPGAEMIVRFLRATDYAKDTKGRDAARRGQFFAERMLGNHLKWRQKWRPDMLTPDDCRTAMDSGNTRFLGVGREGNPVLWAQVSLWTPQHYSKEEFIRYVAFFQHQAERIMQVHGTGTTIIVFDVAGWAFWHVKYLSCKCRGVPSNLQPLACAPHRAKLDDVW